MHLPLGLMPVTRPTPGQIKRQRPGGAFPAYPHPHADAQGIDEFAPFVSGIADIDKGGDPPGPD